MNIDTLIIALILIVVLVGNFIRDMRIEKIAKRVVEDKNFKENFQKELIKQWMEDNKWDLYNLFKDTFRMTPAIKDIVKEINDMQLNNSKS